MLYLYILVPKYSEGGYFFKNETNLGLNYYRTKLKLKNAFKNYFKNSFKSCLISTFNFCFLRSVILQMLSATASSDQHNFGLIRHRNIKIFHMKAIVIFFLSNILTQILFQQKSPFFDVMSK